MPVQGFSAYSAVIAAVFAGLIAYPLLELLKARLADSGASRKAKQEITVKLRVAVGYFDALEDLVKKTFDPDIASLLDGIAPTGPISWKAVKAFDLGPVSKMIEDLARLEGKQSATSAAGQSLTKRLLLTLSAFEQLKAVNPIPVLRLGAPPDEPEPRRLGLREDDEIILDFSLTSLQNLRDFIQHFYAKRLGIDGISFGVDGEIFTFDQNVAMARANKAVEEAQEAYRHMKRQLGEQE